MFSVALMGALTTGFIVPAKAAPLPAPAAVADVQVAAAAKVISTRITSQPVSRTAVQGTTYRVAAKAVGTSLKYQWQKAAPRSSKFVSIKGATRSYLDVKNVAVKASKTRYRVLVTGKKGRVYSKAATMTVRAAAKPVIKDMSMTSYPVTTSRYFVVAGTGFGDVTSVVFDGTKLKYKKVSSSLLSMTLPARSGVGLKKLTVRSASGSSSKTITLVPYLNSVQQRQFLIDVIENCEANGHPYGSKLVAYAEGFDTLQNYRISFDEAVDFRDMASGACAFTASVSRAKWADDDVKFYLARMKALGVERIENAGSDDRDGIKRSIAERTGHLNDAKAELQKVKALGGYTADMKIPTYRNPINSYGIILY